MDEKRTVVNREDILTAVKALGVQRGEILLVHSSFKSMGHVDGGAEAVISAFEEAIGPEGTLVFPTLCAQDFANSYETWYMDKPSDVGYLTNYFRKLPGALRSDQATHSVAARGKLAVWLTETHGHTHKRPGEYGDTPFSADSPWEKMYDRNARVVLLGVEAPKITFRHYAEYTHMERCLKSIEGHPRFPEMEQRVRRWNIPGVWPSTHNLWLWNHILEPQGLTTQATCGDAIFRSVFARDFVQAMWTQLQKRERNIYRMENIDALSAWFDDIEALQQEIK